MWRTGRILFVPDGPDPRAAVTKICARLGHRITTDPAENDFDLAVKWRDATIDRPHPALARLAAGIDVVNRFCDDVSKENVERISREALGYGLALDSTTHRGDCVIKSDANARHDGRVVLCPVAAPPPGWVCRRLVDNEVRPGVVRDLRVPFFRGAAPFVYVKERPVATRFANENASARLEPAEDHFSGEELESLRRVCRLAGMDYGEVDVLRDRGDGRVHPVDLNNTPFGPPNGLSPTDAERAVRMMSDAFRDAFL